MSSPLDLDPFDQAYAYFARAVRDALQRTFEEETKTGLTQKDIADTLDIDPALVSRRLNGPGNITLRTLSDLYTAMGRDPLSNFVAPPRHVDTSAAPRGAADEDLFLRVVAL